jgi:hypothetical protein
MQNKPTMDQRDLYESDDDERDDLDDFIAEIAKSDPDFPARVEAGVQERLTAIARGEDPNDIQWDDEEEGTSAPQPATPQRQ